MWLSKLKKIMGGRCLKRLKTPGVIDYSYLFCLSVRLNSTKMVLSSDVQDFEVGKNE